LCAVTYRKSVKFVTISFECDAFCGEKKINTAIGRPLDFMPGDAASGGGIARVRLAFLTIFLAFSIFLYIKIFAQ